MRLGEVFERFIQQAPISVMFRTLLEHTLDPTEIDRLFEENADSYPTRTALVCDDVRLDYRQLWHRTTRIAQALAAKGVGAGDRILWAGQNCHRLIEVVVAASRRGASPPRVAAPQRPGLPNRRAPN